MDFDFDWVDAFTDQIFGGNGCAVVHGGAGLSDTLCMAYVRETSLVECTFTGPSGVADFKVKYYLASREIPFAGHPTIATVAALRHRGLIGEGPLRLETGAGVVDVVVRGAQIVMTQIAPVFGGGGACRSCGAGGRSRGQRYHWPTAGGFHRAALLYHRPAQSCGAGGVEAQSRCAGGVQRPSGARLRYDGAFLGNSRRRNRCRRYLFTFVTGPAQPRRRPFHRISDRRDGGLSLGAGIDRQPDLRGRAGAPHGPSGTCGG